ncbi:MAG: hypothetical protein VX764_08345 [Planctomycetota bacterium]|nr:hypothetical protein [Planctomycetota bacterium]
MTENADDRLIVPGSTILILFLTLLVVIPVATWRMSRGLASPLVEVVTLVQGEDHFRGRWKIGKYEYLIGQEQDGASSRDSVRLTIRESGQSDSISSSTTDRDGTIESVMFLDPDGDRFNAAVVAIRRPDENATLQLLLYNFTSSGDPASGEWSDMTRIPPHLAIGYYGHDSIERQSEMVVRTFPIYREDDGKLQATGQTRSLIWNFSTGRWRPDPRK